MSTDGERRFALVVATANYADPKLRRLRAPTADAERLAAVLADSDKGGFEVEVLVDEHEPALTRRIATFFADRRPQDLLLAHFSCHGIKDEHGDLYLTACDTEVGLLSATGLSAHWLNGQITRSRSRRTVVLLDCCFAGAFPFGMRARGAGLVDAPEQMQGRGRAIITASSALEYAYEGDDLTGEGRPSIFTSAIVDGLESGEADLDGDQRISVDDLYEFVYRRVQEHTPNQTPSIKSDLEGPLYVARSSFRPPLDAVELDPDLLARLEDRYAGVRAGAAQELGAILRGSDPALAIAARTALQRMRHDDSRSVVATVEEMLTAASAPPVEATTHHSPRPTTVLDVDDDNPEAPPDGPAAADNASSTASPARSAHSDSAVRLAPRPLQWFASQRVPPPRALAAVTLLAVAAIVAIVLAMSSGPKDNGGSENSGFGGGAAPSSTSR